MGIDEICNLAALGQEVAERAVSESEDCLRQQLPFYNVNDILYCVARKLAVSAKSCKSSCTHLMFQLFSLKGRNVTGLRAQNGPLDPSRVNVIKMARDLYYPVGSVYREDWVKCAEAMNSAIGKYVNVGKKRAVAKI